MFALVLTFVDVAALAVAIFEVDADPVRDWLVPQRTWLALLAVIGWLVLAYVPFARLYQENKIRESELQEQSDDLRAQLRDAQDARPSVDVGFIDGMRIIHEMTIRLPPLPSVMTADLDALLEEKRNVLHAVLSQLPDPGPEPPKPEHGISIDRFHWQERAAPRLAYKRAIDDYIESYALYLANLARYLLAKDRLVYLPIGVKNNGRVAQRDIRIWLYFPAGVEGASEEDFRWNRDKDGQLKPIPPEPPSPAAPNPTTASASQSPFSAVHALGSIQDWRPDPSQQLFFPPPTWQAGSDPPNFGPDYDWSEDARVAFYSIRDLIPAMADWDLDPIVLWLGSIRESTMLEIEVEAKAETLPVPHVDKLLLHIVIDPDLTPSQ